MATHHAVQGGVCHLDWQRFHPDEDVGMGVLLRAGLWLAAGVALGRLAGFVREILLAARYGAGPEGDAAVLVLTLPDTLINLLVGSAMAVTLVPHLAERRPQGQDRALIRAALWTATAAGLGLWLGVMAAGVPLVALLAPGLSPSAALAVVAVLPIACAALPAALLSSVLAAVLQERYRTATTALGTLIFNGAVIVGLLMAGPTSTLMALAVALAVGGLLRLLVQVWDVRRDVPAPPPAEHLPLPTGLWRTYVAALLAGGVLILVPVLGRAVASWEGPGGLAMYSYATKLYDLPVGVVLGVVAQALFARLADLRNQGNVTAARSLLWRGLGITVALAAVCALALAVAGPWIAELAFARGNMPVTAAQAIGHEAALLGLALPAAAVATVLTTWMQAGRQVRLPLVAGFAGLLVFGGVALVSPGLRGAILGTMAVPVVMAGILLVACRADLPRPRVQGSKPGGMG